MDNSEKLYQEALAYHDGRRPGKIAVVPTKATATQHDLALAYSPGVAAPCLAIRDDAQKAYDYTNKGNLVAVVSNGTAVLGLGNIGPEASKPVMEGKALLFKIFADIDAFDLEIGTRDVDHFVDTVHYLTPTFGAINLEDIKAPECFEIEQRLTLNADIPIMHDDQHGTAIVSSAALMNALEIAGKNISQIRIVINGAGAAAIAGARLYVKLGVDPQNIVLFDSRGAITQSRHDLTPIKARFASTHEYTSLADAVRGADVFLGLSVPGVLTSEMIRSMNRYPIVFALANPTPEIGYDEAIAAREDIIFATGRSDYPNQVNNVLGFPYIFRGALDTRASEINDAMKIAAAKALAALTHEPVPDEVKKIYNEPNLKFGPSYIIPKPLDPRLIAEVSTAVAQAAIESGVARRVITDWESYKASLIERRSHASTGTNL